MIEPMLGYPSGLLCLFVMSQWSYYIHTMVLPCVPGFSAINSIRSSLDAPPERLSTPYQPQNVLTHVHALLSIIYNVFLTHCRYIILSVVSVSVASGLTHFQSQHCSTGCVPTHFTPLLYQDLLILIWKTCLTPRMDLRRNGFSRFLNLQSFHPNPQILVCLHVSI